MKRVISLLLASSLFLGVWAQDAKSEEKIRKLSLEDAVSLSLENNATIKQQAIDLKLLKEKNNYSWNNVFPTITVSGSYNTNFMDPVSSTYSLSGALNLRLAPSLYTTMKAAKINYEKGLSDYNSTLRSVELSVRKGFLNLLYLKENLDLQKRNLETARQRYVANKEKYNRGQISELDLLTAQYNYESLKPAIETSQITYDSTIAAFKQTLGIDLDEEIELTGNLEDYYKSYNLDVEYNIDDLPSIKKLQTQLDLAQNTLLSTRFSVWGPSVTAAYSYSMNGVVDSGRDPAKSDRLSLGVSIPLDGFLPWSAGAVNVDSVKASVEQLKLQKETAATSAKVDLEIAIRKIKQAQSQLETLKSNVTLAQKTYNMTLTAYNHGSRDLLTLQTASDNLLKSKNSLQLQMYTIISLVMDLENTLGLPFGSLTK